MFRHSKYSSPYGRGKKGKKLMATAGTNTDPTNGGGKAVLYGGANLDAVSPEKLQQMIKTFQGDYVRPNIDKGYGEDQFYGQPRLFDRLRNPVTPPKRAAGGLIDRQYNVDGGAPGQVPWFKGLSADYGLDEYSLGGEIEPTEKLAKFTTTGIFPLKDEGGNLMEYEKGGKWIQGAVNPKHKGYCTPMTKSTCTGARRRFAETMKKHHGFHALGGLLKYALGGLPGDPEKPLSPTDFTRISWKSQGYGGRGDVLDSTHLGPLYRGSFSAFNRLNKTVIPEGTDPNSMTYQQNPAGLDNLLNPRKKLPALNIAGSPSATSGAHATFAGGGSLVAIHRKPGGSNVGKKHFANGKKRTGPYVGQSGGAPSGSYPVPDIGHARAALRLAGHAPNPAGIRAAVLRKFPQLKKKCTGGTMRFSAGQSAWKGGKAYG